MKPVIAILAMLASLAIVPNPPPTLDYRTLEATHPGVVTFQTGVLSSDGLSVKTGPSSWVFPYDIYLWGLTATSESKPGPLNAVIIDADLPDQMVWGARWQGDSHYASISLPAPTIIHAGTHIGMMLQHGRNSPEYGFPAPNNVRAVLHYTTYEF